MYKSYVIVGAPRSGTNMLRDMLVALQGVETWKCDEINYIWRHGNMHYPSDEFTPHMASHAIKHFIGNEFDKLAKSTNADIVVEKTCANSMRLGFVDKILPEAKYIYIVRDGIDVVGSVKLRWKTKLDIPYLLKKARYVPLIDLPYYSTRYLGSRLYKLFSKEQRLSFWGPQMNDMVTLMREYSLTQICALQWLCCVENTERDLRNIDADRILKVRYEDFVRSPSDEFKRIAFFMGKDVPVDVDKFVVEKVTDKGIGKGKLSMSEADMMEILPLINEKLLSYRYEY